MCIQNHKMRPLSDRLIRNAHATEKELRKVGEKNSQEPILPGKWSCKQIHGPLIDSAFNNHQRFRRAALQDSLDSPGTNLAPIRFVQRLRPLGGSPRLAFR
jgi:hypothetical protein